MDGRNTWAWNKNNKVYTYSMVHLFVLHTWKLRQYALLIWLKIRIFLQLLVKFFNAGFESLSKNSRTDQSKSLYQFLKICSNLPPIHMSSKQSVSFMFYDYTCNPILYNSITSCFIFTTIIKCTCNVIMKYSLLFLLILSFLASYYGQLINMVSAILNKNKRCVKN